MVFINRAIPDLEMKFWIVGVVEPFQNLMSRRALCGKKVKKTRNMSRCWCFFCRLFGGDAVLVLT